MTGSVNPQPTPPCGCRGRPRSRAWSSPRPSRWAWLPTGAWPRRLVWPAWAEPRSVLLLIGGPGPGGGDIAGGQGRARLFGGSGAPRAVGWGRGRGRALCGGRTLGCTWPRTLQVAVSGEGPPARLDDPPRQITAPGPNKLSVYDNWIRYFNRTSPVYGSIPR